MSNLGEYLWLIPALPLAASAVTAFLGPKFLGRHSHWPCILAVIGSCVLALLVFSAFLGNANPVEVTRYYTWFQAGSVDVGFTLRADTLTAFMLVTVTFIGSLIAIY